MVIRFVLNKLGWGDNRVQIATWGTRHGIVAKDALEAGESVANVVSEAVLSESAIGYHVKTRGVLVDDVRDGPAERC